MSAVLVPGVRGMAKRKKQDEGSEKGYSLDASGNARVEFVAAPEWLAEVDEFARALGMGRSAYIRMAVNERLDTDRAKRRKQ
jgi:hypothetical protein